MLSVDRRSTVTRAVYATLIFAMLAVLAWPASTRVNSAPAIGSLTVNTLDDKANIASLEDGKCSLREAIQAANTDTAVNTTNGADCPAGNGADIITFGVAGTITLKDKIFVNTDIAIEGPITLSGGGENRIFQVTQDGVLSLSNMTLQDADGGAIVSQQGTLNILAVSFQNNVNSSDGGAINSNGELNILMSTFAGNEAGSDTSGASGGALAVSGYEPVRISLTNFSGNTASRSGGAIAITGNTTEVEISDSIFSGNIAEGDGPTTYGGGAIFNKSDELEIIRCAFNGNLSPKGSGGALHNAMDAAVAIRDSSFNGNVSGNLIDSGGQGGAIYNLEKAAFVRSTFNGNVALSTPTEAGQGGAIRNDKVGDVAVTNSTFFGNIATPPNGQGGAIYNADASHSSAQSKVSLRHVTVINNVAGEGGAIYNIHNEAVELYNTIVAQGALGSGGTCAGKDWPAGQFPVTDGGGNLQHPGTDCGSMTSADPKLADAPSFDGGAIVTLLTFGLKDDSPAIDQANNANCAAEPVNGEDQRGKPRPTDGDGDGTLACDIGAIEAEAAIPGYGSTPVQPGPISFGTTVVGTGITTTFKVFETGNATLKVTSLALGGPHAADFGLLTAPFNIPNGGSSVAVTLACTPTVTGDRTATLSLATNDPDHLAVSYQLICTGASTPQPGFSSTPAAPGPVNWGNVTLGTIKAASFEISEVGDAALVVSNPVLSGVNPGDFAVTTAFPLNIADGAPAQAVNLTCQPGAPGLRTATLALTTNDSSHPTVSFNLTCNGVLPPDPPLDLGPIISASVGFSPYDVAISPDGKHVYVTNVEGGKLAVYTRTAATGELDLIAAYGAPNLSAPRSVELSPDGKQVFVTSPGADALHVLARNTASGMVSAFDVIQDGDLVGCWGSPPVCLLVDGLDGAAGLALSPDGRNIYVAAEDDNAVSVFSRQAPTGTVNYVQRKKEGQAGVSGLLRARDVAVSPDGRHVYVASSDSNTAGSDGSLALFSRDPANGYLTFVKAYEDGGSLRLGGATAVALSPDGAQVYVAASGDGALTVFNRDPANGTLTAVQVWVDMIWMDGFDGAHGIATSPDGSQVYVSTVGDNTLIVLKRDPLSGKLSREWTYWDGVDGVDGLWWASKVAASPDGGHVYVTGYLDRAVTAFGRAKPTPLLTSLDPASVIRGAPQFTLGLFGEKFGLDSVVRWNGSDRPTTFVSGVELEATISAADVAAPGTATVQVYTPPPGGGTSNALQFTIGQPGDNPIPSLVSLDPASAMAGDPGLTLLVNGANFIQGAVVRWNGVARTTTFSSSTQLRATIPTSDLAAPGPAGVMVVNPGPGGGSSNALTFKVVAPGANPVPSIARLSPARVCATRAAGRDLTLTIAGANFIPQSQVYLGENPRVTQYVSEAQLKATLAAGDTAFPQALDITVFNPMPGGGRSNIAVFRAYTCYMVFLPPVLK